MMRQNLWHKTAKLSGKGQMAEFSEAKDSAFSHHIYREERRYLGFFPISSRSLATPSSGRGSRFARFLFRLRQPITQRRHMVLVMLERVASYQLPGSPLLRHVLEVVRVIEILVAKLLYHFQENCICLPLFVDNVV